MTDVEQDLRLAIDLLEEVAQCVVGCGCWRAEGSKPPWDDPQRLREAIRRRDRAWSVRVGAALDRLVALADEDARVWSTWLAGELDACRACPPQDPRVFFARARAVMNLEDARDA